SVEAAQAQARHAAQMAARREAEFTRDLVQRRDTLANQLRWLYRPHPKVYGRGPDGPDKLRTLAGDILKSPKEVDKLLAWGMGEKTAPGRGNEERNSFRWVSVHVPKRNKFRSTFSGACTSELPGAGYLPQSGFRFWRVQRHDEPAGHPPAL